MATSRHAGGCLLKALAGICACLFVVSTPIVLALLTADLKLLGPDTYKQALVEQDVYQRLPALLAEQIVYGGSVSSTGEEEGSGSNSERAFIATIFVSASADLISCLEDELGLSAYEDLRNSSRDATSTELDRVKGCLRSYGVPAAAADTQGGMPVFFWLLSADDWEVVLDGLLPPEWLETQAESLIDQVWTALRSDESHAVLSVPLADLKARVEGEPGHAALVQIIDAQPPCTTDQLAQISGLASSSDPLKDVPICRPPQEVLDLIEPNIQATLDFMTDQMPNTAELKLVDDSDPSSASEFDSLRHAVRTLDLVSRLALLVPIVLLALITALAVRSTREFLRWWGIPLLVTGWIGLGLVAAGLTATRVATGQVHGGSGGLSPGLVDLAVDTAGSLAQGFALTFGLEMLLIALAGLGMVVASLVVRGKEAGLLPTGGPPPLPVSGPPAQTGARE